MRPCLRILILSVLMACQPGVEEGNSNARTSQEAPSARLDAHVQSCGRIDSRSISVSLDIIATGWLSQYDIDATPTVEMFNVVAEFADGDYQDLPWALDTADDGPTMTFTLSTSDMPAALTLKHLTVALVVEAAISSSSFEGLRGQTLDFGQVRADVRSAVLEELGAGIELVMRPAEIGAFVPMGVDDLRLIVDGVAYSDDYTDFAPSDGFVAQRVFMRKHDARQTPNDREAASLIADKLILQYDRDLIVSLRGCPG
jgi:hypothetical protein